MEWNRGVFSNANGAFSLTGNRFIDWGATGSVNNSDGFEIDASLLSEVYGRSTRVQPYSMRVLICIKF